MVLDIRILVGVCFVLFFIVIFLLQAIGTCGNISMIHGFWAASEQFMEDANIDQMVFYFDEGKGHNYKGYMVIVVDGETVFNDTLEFRITPKGYFKTSSYGFVMSKSTGVMPVKMTMELDIYTGAMTLKCMRDNKIYAVLFKDNQMSAKTILDMEDSDTITVEANDTEDV